MWLHRLAGGLRVGSTNFYVTISAISPLDGSGDLTEQKIAFMIEFFSWKKSRN